MLSSIIGTNRKTVFVSVRHSTLSDGPLNGRFELNLRHYEIIRSTCTQTV